MIHLTAGTCRLVLHNQLGTKVIFKHMPTIPIVDMKKML